MPFAYHGHTDDKGCHPCLHIELLPFMSVFGTGNKMRKIGMKSLGVMAFYRNFEK